MKLKTVTAIALFAFAFFYITIVMFGKMQASPLFSIVDYLLIVCILGAIYFAQRKKISGLFEHLAVILVILVISSSLAYAGTALKVKYDSSSAMLAAKQSFENGIQTLQEQNTYYSQYLDYLTNQTKALDNNNNILEQQISQLDTNITAKNQKVLSDALSQMQAKYNAQQQVLEDEIQTLQDQIQQLQLQIQNQQSTISSQASTIQSLQNTIAQQSQVTGNE